MWTFSQQPSECTSQSIKLQGGAPPENGVRYIYNILQCGAPQLQVGLQTP